MHRNPGLTPKSRLDPKIPVLGSMFPEKIEFDGEKYRTCSYNKVLGIIYQQTNELRGGEETKKRVDCSTLRVSAQNRTTKTKFYYSLMCLYSA